MPPDLAQPWRGFLTELDGLVAHEVRLHCFGGFVVTMRNGLARTTADLDVLSILPTEDQRALATVAGKGSALQLTRNADRDRSDVEYLGTVVPLDVAVLRERYQNEMRSYVGVPEREDLTLELWIDIIQEAQRARVPSKPHVVHTPPAGRRAGQ